MSLSMVKQRTLAKMTLLSFHLVPSEFFNMIREIKYATFFESWM